MTVSKITNAPTQKELIDKTNEIIDNLGGGSATDVQINGTSITSDGVANIVTNSAYNASSNKIATMSDLPGDEIFIAEYGVTSYQDVEDAFTSGKTIICYDNSIPTTASMTYCELSSHGFDFSTCILDNSYIEYNLASDDTWTQTPQSLPSTSGLADRNLFNLSATGEAHFQKPLISGTNIKTINNTSLLGSGNIDIQGGTTDVQINGTSITNQGVANIVTNSAYNASSNKIATMSDLPTVTTYTGGTGISIGTGNAINHTNSVTASTIGTSSATSGSTISVPYATYDAQGHITAKGTHTHTVTGFLTSSSSLVASSRFDGQWVRKYLHIEGSSTANGSYSQSIADYLPADANTYYYEVLIQSGGYSTAGSSFAIGTVSSPYTNASNSFGWFNSFTTSSSRYSSFDGILIFGNGNKTIYWQIANGAQGIKPNIYLYAYKRIGTNT